MLCWPLWMICFISLYSLYFVLKQLSLLCGVKLTFFISHYGGGNFVKMLLPKLYHECKQKSPTENKTKTWEVEGWSAVCGVKIYYLDFCLSCSLFLCRREQFLLSCSVLLPLPSLQGQYCGSIKLLQSCDKWLQKLQQNPVLILNFKSHP